MAPRFERVAPIVNFPDLESRIRALWNERDVFARTLEKRQGGKRFVFYDGPPTANGLPHNGSALTRVFKDVFPRYRSMRGYDVPRKAGWDTHGLPVEIEVEKELRISGKEAIDRYGVEPFVRSCIESVFRYTKEWTQLTQELGCWLDLEHAYVTYHESYVESVWWALSELFKRGLLYQGHKVVWWWAQGGTALSAAEVGQGYRTVEDPSLYVRFPAVSGPGHCAPCLDDHSLDAPVEQLRRGQGRRRLRGGPRRSRKADRGRRARRTARRKSWARTPGGAYASRIRPGRPKIPPAVRLVHAQREPIPSSGGSSRRPSWNSTREPESSTSRPPSARWTSICCAASAPAIRTCPLLCAVRPDGGFDPEVAPPEFAGRWVKDADRDLIRELKARGLAWHVEQIRHDYPFCERSEQDPLIQYARPAWYVRTTSQVAKALATNARIQWLPEHIREGRFGDFLRNNVDWALSRERFWGTPLNIWVNDATGATDAPASVAEILARNPRAFDDFEAARAQDPTLSPAPACPQAVDRRRHVDEAGRGGRMAPGARGDRRLV